MPSEQKVILLFEDDFESMRDLKEHVEDEFGWHVELTAEQSLLDQLSRKRFDLVVIDLMIHPVSLDANGQEVENVHFDNVNWRKTGLEFLRRLRRGEYAQQLEQGTTPDVPVIILSAIANDSVGDELRKKLAIQAYVEKPFRLHEMIELMRRLLGGSADVNETRNLE